MKKAEKQEYVREVVAVGVFVVALFLHLLHLNF